MSHSLALLLHAHLPFVRHPEQGSCVEERWLFEAITESYVPLLRMMQRLRADDVPFRLTLSISPTLAAMLSDNLLRQRYAEHLKRLIALAEKECERNSREEKNLLSLSQFYLEFFSETDRVFAEEWNCDLLAIIRQLQDDGAVELIASAATHAILPILHASADRIAQAQIAIGCEFFRKTFGRDPVGFWLPECAYSPALDELLQKENLRWFVLDAHGLENGQPSARRGPFAPCFTPAGPAAFARDVEASAQIWSAEHGYPGDFWYRDFYRDIGFDLTEEQLAPLTPARGRFSGLKYHRVTGRDVAKELYLRELAEEKAHRHARHFVELCARRLKAANHESAILVLPFDAELFGHWWFEGPLFLEHVIRTAAQAGLPLITPTDLLSQNPPLQILQPATSSWGEGGFLDVWLDGKCGWIHAPLHAANQRMIELANRYAGNTSPAQDRVMRQLARELLLAQASDWPFHIRNGTASEYGTAQVRDHLARFNRLADETERGNLDPDFLAQCENHDNLFPNLNWRHYCHPGRSAAKARDPAPKT